ncbi:LOW QUALITY PROTEIN: G-protein coupled receptor 35-like [Tachyglossus aculeatus]|uniref:LOW QUALITY PROTEIN: G-protein coupled receptor 35-like n=1 Tax=Tachyglossus aculeatus TaxID=9261 RepID=UPI0018F2CF23|nr:LOW QUALITY PROTEIN: G-protein coupled receptor 35-like [Tachyglossus aculeatus]
MNENVLLYIEVASDFSSLQKLNFEYELEILPHPQTSTRSRYVFIMSVDYMLKDLPETYTFWNSSHQPQIQFRSISSNALVFRTSHRTRLSYQNDSTFSEVHCLGFGTASRERPEKGEEAEWDCYHCHLRGRQSSVQHFLEDSLLCSSIGPLPTELWTHSSPLSYTCKTGDRARLQSGTNISEQDMAQTPPQPPVAFKLILDPIPTVSIFAIEGSPRLPRNCATTAENSTTVNYSMNCNLERTNSTKTATFVSMGTIFFLGLIFNSLALWVFCCKMKKWTGTRVYMINLVVADCSLLVSLPFILSTLHQENDGTGFCKISQTIYLINTHMSICTITVIAADRYIAIKYPLKSKSWRSPKKAVLICGILWIIVISSVSVSAITGENFCFGKKTTRDFTSTLFSLLGFFIPLVILSFCSIQVIISLIKKKKMATCEETAIQKTLVIVLANLIVFIICFLPLHVALLLKLVVDSVDSSCPFQEGVIAFIRVASRIANSNCCFDAVGYYFVAKEFQEASATAIPKFLRSRGQKPRHKLHQPSLMETEIDVPGRQSQNLVATC